MKEFIKKIKYRLWLFEMKRTLKRMKGEFERCQSQRY